MDSDTTSDKISSVKDLQASQRLRKAILEMYDDGYTVHEISESLIRDDGRLAIHCTEIAEVVAEAIREDAGRCA